ncbi:MAG: 2-C-methyl-D-erythritol 2,4-cyclodiphosphate synthase, partial [Candidatus Limnocylindria bacterium]
MPTSHPFAAILVAAGASRRMGHDKLWTDFWGRPVWRWALDVFLAQPGLTRVVVMVPADAIERFREALPAAAADRCIVATGGAARADSVIAGLWALTAAGHDDDTLVLVHDAARPAVSAELVDSVVAAGIAAGERAVVPVVPIVDSLKRVRGERVVSPVEREDVVAAQTPQAARLGPLRAAIEEAHAWGRPITDDAGALAAAGVPVHTVPGDPLNRKLTDTTDLAPMRAVLAERVVALGAPDAVAKASIGIGFDAHRLVAGSPMRLGALTWDDEPRGPLGHSDGDVALHALIDALLGA